MKTFTISVQPKGTEKAKDVRINKKVPGVIYGSKEKNTPITANAKELRSLFAQAGHSNVIDINIEGSEKPIKAIIHDLQFDPLSDEITHVDFFAIDMKKKITTSIPIKLVGISEAVKTFGGMLITNRNEINIKCLPGDLMPFIEVDISSLATLNDSIKMKDLKVPETIEILEDMDQTVAHVEEPRVQTYEEEIKPEAAAEGAAVEGEKKDEEAQGKEEKEGKKE